MRNESNISKFKLLNLKFKILKIGCMGLMILHSTKEIHFFDSLGIIKVNFGPFIY